jgi:hypothetical protein
MARDQFAIEVSVQPGIVMREIVTEILEGRVIDALSGLP